MKIKLNRIIFLTITAFLTKAWSYTAKEGNVTATFGPYFYKTNAPIGDSRGDFPWKGDFGLMALGDINDKSSLEIAIFHMDKTFFRDDEGHLIAEKSKLLHTTLGYRNWLNPYFAAGLSFYSSYTLGDYMTVYNDYPVGVDTDTSARDITEYGLDISLLGELWSSGRWGLIVDGRYSYPFTSKPHEKAEHYALFLGVRYFIQGKDKEPQP